MNELIPVERIERRIYQIRGQKVMLDNDLAKLYGVSTGRLNEQVKRNLKRFPIDFMFSLTRQEILNISQIAISSNIKHAKNVNVFTENGVAMLSSVLRSERAIQVNVQIMRAFTRLRQILSANKDLSYLFKELKHKVDQHDVEIGLIIRAIEKMIAVDTKPKRKIGYIKEDEK
jgi:hypothetical protein